MGVAYLEELKSLLVDAGAVITSALGEIVNDGTVVRLRPGIRTPLDIDLAASGDSGGDLAGLGFAVANDVAGGVAAAINETVVTVVGAPGDDVRRAGHVDVVVEEAVVRLAINGDAGDTAVSVGRGGKGAQEGGGLEESHLVCFVGFEERFC